MTRLPWSLLVVACATQIATYACFFNLTPLLPRVGSDLQLDAGALGALIGVGGVVALLVQLPAGSASDIFGRRPFFVLGMVLLLIALALRWQAQHAAMLLLSQVAAGAALGVVSTNAFALMAGMAHKGPAFGIVNASISVGQVVGYLIAGTFGAWLGWRDMSVAWLRCRCWSWRWSSVRRVLKNTMSAAAAGLEHWQSRTCWRIQDD